MSQENAGRCSMSMEERTGVAYKEARVSIAGNMVLFAVKLVLGLMISSIALIADAFHSLSDIGTSAVVYLGFRGARKAPDREHPFGHGRMEHIATLIIGTLLVSVGIEFIYEAGMGFMEEPTIIVNDYLWIIVAVIAGTVVAKEAMARYSNKLARDIDSDTLKADAWHHRADALSSVAVMFALVGSYLGYPILDPIFGLMVSLFIIYTGIDIVRDSIDVLMGRAASIEAIKKVEACAMSVHGVVGAHRIVIHDYGQKQVVSLHIEVQKSMSLDIAHRISDEVESCISRELGMPATVHVDPKACDASECTVIGSVEQILESQEGIISYHKLDVKNVGPDHKVYVHIIVAPETTLEQSHAIEHELIERIRKACSGCDVNIHMEPLSIEEGHHRKHNNV